MQNEGRMVVDSQKGKNVTGRMITARRSIKDVTTMGQNSHHNAGAQVAVFSGGPMVSDALTAIRWRDA